MLRWLQRQHTGAIKLTDRVAAASDLERPMTGVSFRTCNTFLGVLKLLADGALIREWPTDLLRHLACAQTV